MFKKQHNQKTAAPIRSSERRKLRSKVVEDYQLQEIASEDIDLLVPDGLLSAKFVTHLNEPGVVYLSPDGDPLWFSYGKGSTTLIPTVYTLWKRPILPILATNSEVIPILIGGADLMIPGVSKSTVPPGLSIDDIVGIAGSSNEVPLAVGTMAVPSNDLKLDKKGKAVYVLHTWEDSLYDIGSQNDPPESVLPFTTLVAPKPPVSGVAEITSEGIDERDTQTPADGAADNSTSQTSPTGSKDGLASGSTDLDTRPSDLSPGDVDDILRQALLQAIKAQLSTMPQSSFPIPASTFYSTYILPSRPSSSPSSADIKKSSYKKLAKFLQVFEKQGILRLKDSKGDVVVTGVSATHVDVVAHRPFKTIGAVEASEVKAAKAAVAEAAKVRPMEISELYKPHGQSVQFFEMLRKSVKELYSLGELKIILNDYISSNSLVHPREPQYITLDPLLASILLKKNENLDFLRRDEAISRLKDIMQVWHSVTLDGKDSVPKKGLLQPISVIVKIRQGRKASTLITNFEDYFISAEFLSEELRKSCASATSVSPVQGKPSKSEVLIQGKQIKAVTELLIAQGVPKRWIEATDLTDKKK